MESDVEERKFSLYVNDLIRGRSCELDTSWEGFYQLYFDVNPSQRWAYNPSLKSMNLPQSVKVSVSSGFVLFAARLTPYIDCSVAEALSALPVMLAIIIAIAIALAPARDNVSMQEILRQYSPP